MAVSHKNLEKTKKLMYQTFSQTEIILIIEDYRKTSIFRKKTSVLLNKNTGMYI